MLYLPLGAFNLPAIFGSTRTGFIDQIKLEAVHAFVTTGKSYGDPAQIAVEAALLKNAGISLLTQTREVLPASPWGGPGQRSSPAPIAAAATPVRRAARRHPARLAG